MARMSGVKWFLQFLTPLRTGSCVAILCLGLFMAGCDQDGVKVYKVVDVPASAPSDQSSSNVDAGSGSPAMPAALPGISGAADATLPQMDFSLPPGWGQIPPSEMRVASFLITNQAGPSAEVGVIPLPSGEDQTALVNMWRGQLQLPPTNRADSTPVMVGNGSGLLFELASTQPVLNGKYIQRNLVAMVNRGNMSWFFKMTGEDGFVSGQKDNFLAFLKSVRWEDSPSSTLPAMSESPGISSGGDAAGATAGIWDVPPGWQPLAGSPFLLAQYKIQSDQAQAEVNVGQLAGDGGGLLANVNRWRHQLSLPPVPDEDGLASFVQDLTLPQGMAKCVDLTGKSAGTGQPTDMVGVVLPLLGQTWFYKLMGDTNLVAAHRDEFLKFVSSARYTNGH